MEKTSHCRSTILKFILATFFTFVFIIICRTFRDYGVTWDESPHRDYGDFIIRWYQSVFKDTSAIHHPFLFLYGGFFDVLVQLINFFSPWGYFETRHLLGALFGLWTIFISFKIAQHVSGDLSGFFTVIFLTLHPVFYGHMFNNPVDTPFAALLLTTLYSLISTYDHLPKLSPKDLFKIGLPLGLMLAIRVAGLLIVLSYMLALWALWLGNHRLHDRKGATAPMKQILRELILNMLWIFGIAWPVMLLWWPWAQLNPIINPLMAVFRAAKWDLIGDLAFFFEGHYFAASNLPKSYMFKLILVTLPEFFFIALFIGGILSVFQMTRKTTWTVKQIKTGFLIFACIFPVLTGSLLTLQFDGYRHFLFTIPLLAILGGLSFAAMFDSKMARWIKIFSCLAIIFSLGLTILDMVRLHPYETVYFNSLQAGGLANGAKKYETDYWGNSYKEGTEWVIKNYYSNLKRKIRVMNASHPSQIGYYLEKTTALKDRFEVVFNDPDIYLATTRWEAHRALPGRILYQVRRDNTPLLYVIEVLKKPT